jgi:hypothetical protein
MGSGGTDVHAGSSVWVAYAGEGYGVGAEECGSYECSQQGVLRSELFVPLLPPPTLTDETHV